MHPFPLINVIPAFSPCFRIRAKAFLSQSGTHSNKMRFKTSNLKECKHSELVSCVSWASPDEVVSAADDGKILRWNLVSAETRQSGELPEECHPTDMHWLPRAANAPKGPQKGQKGGQVRPSAELFLLTSAEGRLMLVGKSSRIEKNVEAHRGACIAGRYCLLFQ